MINMLRSHGHTTN